MPPLETKDLKQTAVLWSFLGYDDYGKPIHRTPVELSPLAVPRNGVRWLTKRRMMTDAQGNLIALDATAVVAQKIDPDSLLWLGSLSEWYGTGSALNLETLGNELMIVKLYNEAPDLKNRLMNIRRDVGMMKYKGQPVVVPLPSVPTNLQASGGVSQAILTWDAQDAVSFNVYQGLSSGGESPVPIATGLMVHNLIVVGLLPGTRYYFIVRATNIAGVSDPSNEAMVLTLLTMPLGYALGAVPQISVVGGIGYPLGAMLS